MIFHKPFHVTAALYNPTHKPRSALLTSTSALEDERTKYCNSVCIIKALGWYYHADVTPHNPCVSSSASSRARRKQGCARWLNGKRLHQWGNEINSAGSEDSLRYCGVVVGKLESLFLLYLRLVFWSYFIHIADMKRKHFTFSIRYF